MNTTDFQFSVSGPTQSQRQKTRPVQFLKQPGFRNAMTAVNAIHLIYAAILLAFAVPVLRAQCTMPQKQAIARIGKLMSILSVISIAYTLLAAWILTTIDN
ncbi:hypothetical protein RISK_006028 [Rhodopirellula islandica]|uniref:Transmembrane protein n=1 Tax=Rhodopirellula islandica TaxID=595434 RepID=A0A0J1E8Q1_RHOIS|nr:hypothetical protein [Rhodopirellula islandica]KLU01844.1 hypothetical protein RISK_006028 [Rhodopirellula islandica]